MIFVRFPIVTFDVPSTFETSGWIKFNRFQKGFYRVNYPENIWSRFSNDLQANNAVITYLYNIQCNDVDKICDENGYSLYN